MDDIEKIQEQINREDLVYKAGKCKYDFQQCETIRPFSESIYTGKINIDKYEMDQTNLLENMVNSNNKTRPKHKYLMLWKVEYFQCKKNKEKDLKYQLLSKCFKV